MDNVHGVCVRMTSVGMHTKEHHRGVNALDVDADVGMLCHAMPCSALLCCAPCAAAAAVYSKSNISTDVIAPMEVCGR